MKIKNSLGLGVLLGLMFPVIAYLLTNHTDMVGRIMPSKPTGIYILAVAINMIAVWVAYRKGKENLGKGIVLTTFLAMLLAVFTKTVVI